MAGGASPGARELDQTPTWAVALVVAVIIVISIALEKVLHSVGEVYNLIFIHFFAFVLFIQCFFSLIKKSSISYEISLLQLFEHKKKEALYEALQKVKGGKITSHRYIFTTFLLKTHN